jgi:hypothetical protein
MFEGIEMKKLLLLAMACLVAPSLFANGNHLVVYKCKEKIKMFGNEDTDKESIKGYMIIEFNAAGEIVAASRIETDKIDGQKVYETEFLSNDDVAEYKEVVVHTSETKEEALIYRAADDDTDADSLTGKLKDTDVGAGDDVPVAKSLKGTGFEHGGNSYETSKNSYRMWSKQTKLANSTEEGGDAGDLAAATASLEAYLESKKHVAAQL